MYRNMLASVSCDWETVKNVVTGNSSLKPDRTGRDGKFVKQSKMHNNSAHSRLGNNAKYAYEKNLAARLKTDNKLFWNYVSKNSRTKKSVTKLLMPYGNLTSSDQETANTLNEYFSSVFTNENKTHIPNFEDSNFNEILDEISITEKKLKMPSIFSNPQNLKDLTNFTLTF